MKSNIVPAAHLFSHEFELKCGRRIARAALLFQEFTFDGNGSLNK